MIICPLPRAERCNVWRTLPHTTLQQASNKQQHSNITHIHNKSAFSTIQQHISALPKKTTIRARHAPSALVREHGKEGEGRGQVLAIFASSEGRMPRCVAHSASYHPPPRQQQTTAHQHYQQTPTIQHFQQTNPKFSLPKKKKKHTRTACTLCADRQIDR